MAGTVLPQRATAGARAPACRPHSGLRPRHSLFRPNKGVQICRASPGEGEWRWWHRRRRLPPPTRRLPSAHFAAGLLPTVRPTAQLWQLSGCPINPSAVSSASAARARPCCCPSSPNAQLAPPAAGLPPALTLSEAYALLGLAEGSSYDEVSHLSAACCAAHSMGCRRGSGSNNAARAATPGRRAPQRCPAVLADRMQVLSRKNQMLDKNADNMERRMEVRSRGWRARPLRSGRRARQEAPVPAPAPASWGCLA